LPVLRGQRVTLRELRLSDAPALLAQVSRPEVLRHISPAPTTVEGFRAFIRWTHRQRRRGMHMAFGVIPAGTTTPVGIVQCWPVELDWTTAEWGFVMGRDYWGSGLFGAGARLLLDFAFQTMGVMRMEARSAQANGRGNGALLKLGAIPEGILRDAFRQASGVGNHVMWSILNTDWSGERIRHKRDPS
jgi:ribosomal-protein-alanine N-acetyltransferase